MAEAGTGGATIEAGAGARRDAGDSGALDQFAAWEQALTALRKSPDHLPARADEVVASKDPAKIFAFVRDEIATYPPSDDGFANALSARRWGERATLRGGAGTPREKAELLLSLYKRAGLTAEVVRGTADPSTLTGQEVLLRSITRNFAPPITSSQSAAWLKALGHDAPTPRTLIDQDDSQARALATSLMTLLPSTLTSPFDFTITDFPLVRVQVGGSWTYANPIAPGAMFGDSVTASTPTPTGVAGALPTVLVRLEAVRANDPYTKFTLVEHQYAADDVVGRRIHIGFAPPVDTATLVRTIQSSVTTFVPVLSVAGADMTQADRDSLGFAGKPVSLGGDVYDVDTSGAVTVNGAPLVTPTGDPTAAAKVATVTASASGSSFPSVSLRVKALDGSGAGVPGLGASSITVTEDGKPVSFNITQNKAPPPRVVLLFDASSSLPAAFRGAGAVTVGTQVVQSLYAKYPNAGVRVGYVSFGVIWTTGGWATTQAAAQAEVNQLATASGSSELWQALADAEAESPTLVVLVTDGAATDQSLPKYRNGIASGAPVLSIGVGTVTQATLDDVSTLSGGRSVPVTQQADAVTAVLADIDKGAHVDYVINYRAPKTGAASRSVTVEINGKKVQVGYDVPATPTIPPAIAGLYLTISTGGRTATRAVAGFARGFTSAPPVITDAMLEDVHSSFLGRISTAVEGAAPMPSVVLDDWISEKLELRPLWEAANAKDQQGIMDALKAGFSLTPAKLPLAQPPLPDASSPDSLTFESGLRIATVVQKAHDGGPVTRELDLFPLSRFRTAAADPHIAWQRTFERTAALAVVEDGLFTGNSTMKALAGQTLTAVNAGSARNQAGLTTDEQLAWAWLESPFKTGTTLLVPVKPGPFWAVDQASGTVLGMLPDGAGGATEDACSTYNLANSYLQLMSLLGTFFGVNVGGWVGLAQWEVKYVTIATIVIGGGDLPPEAADPNGNFDMTSPALAVGCDLLDNEIGNHVPGYSMYGSIVGTLQTANVDAANHAPTLCGGGSICQ